MCVCVFVRVREREREREGEKEKEGGRERCGESRIEMQSERLN